MELDQTVTGGQESERAGEGEVAGSVLEEGEM